RDCDGRSRHRHGRLSACRCEGVSRRRPRRTRAPPREGSRPHGSAGGGVRSGVTPHAARRTGSDTNSLSAVRSARRGSDRYNREERRGRRKRGDEGGWREAETLKEKRQNQKGGVRWISGFNFSLYFLTLFPVLIVVGGGG